MSRAHSLSTKPYLARGPGMPNLPFHSQRKSIDQQSHRYDFLLQNRPYENASLLSPGHFSFTGHDHGGANNVSLSWRTGKFGSLSREVLTGPATVCCWG